MDAFSDFDPYLLYEAVHGFVARPFDTGGFLSSKIAYELRFEWLIFSSVINEILLLEQKCVIDSSTNSIFVLLECLIARVYVASILMTPS
jgi:hypothetical protein